MRAEAMGTKTRQESWQRIAAQVQDSSKDPQQQHAGTVGDFGVTASAIFLRIGMRQYPLHVEPRVARDLFDLRNIVRLRRVEFNHWDLAP